MDALVRRLALLAAPLVALAAGAGCGLLDRRDRGYPQDEGPPPVERGQAPADVPLPPVSLPPQPTSAAPVEPLRPLGGAAPVVPAGPVTTVSARTAAADAAAATRVKVVATVGADTIITDEEVGLLMKQRANEYLMLKGDERERKEREVYRDCLRALIERELLITDFLGKVKKNKPGVLPELWEQAGRMADEQLKAMRNASRGKKIETEAEFARLLDEMGMPYKLFRRQVERASMVNLFLGTMLKEKNGSPTLAQLQDYYARHQAEFKTADRVKYLDLFVSLTRFGSEADARAHVDGLFKQALGGADFAELVKKHGHGDSPLRDGVGVGTKRGEIQPAELEATVFDLKPGNISGVVPTETGFHVVKVVERQVAGVRPFDEKLQNEIRYKLMDQASKAERDKLVTDLWRRTGVTVVER